MRAIFPCLIMLAALVPVFTINRPKPEPKFKEGDAVEFFDGTEGRILCSYGHDNDRYSVRVCFGQEVQAREFELTAVIK